MIQKVKSVLTGSNGRTVVCECRHCGAPLDASDERCPTCELGRAVRYEV